jgi:Xaa-Pro aminopeptidase
LNPAQLLSPNMPKSPKSLRQKMPLELVPLENIVENLRTFKEPEEIDFIQKAAEIGDRAFEYVAGRLKTGMTEKEIAWALEKHMRENSSGSVPFEVIVGQAPTAPCRMLNRRTVRLRHMNR